LVRKKVKEYKKDAVIGYFKVLKLKNSLSNLLIEIRTEPKTSKIKATS